MSKHTPEPWYFHKGMVVYGHEEIDIRDEANAQRAIACVNACAGINPDAVPDAVAALRACEIALGDKRIGTYNMDSPDWYEKVWEARDAARAALAKLKATNDL